MFLAMASAFLFACSESDDPSPIVDNSIPEGSVVFDISTVNKLNNGMSRGNVYSQEATQHVTRARFMLSLIMVPTMYTLKHTILADGQMVLHSNAT